MLALLPTGSSQPQVAGMPQIDAVDAVVAAGAAVSDMSDFCERQPEACEVGAQAAVAIGQRAQAGAKMVYEFIQRAHEHAAKPARSAPAGQPRAAADGRLAEHADAGRSRAGLARPAGAAPGSACRCRARARKRSA